MLKDIASLFLTTPFTNMVFKFEEKDNERVPLGIEYPALMLDFFLTIILFIPKLILVFMFGICWFIMEMFFNIIDIIEKHQKEKKHDYKNFTE